MTSLHTASARRPMAGYFQDQMPYKAQTQNTGNFVAVSGQFSWPPTKRGDWARTRPRG
jgi:hypothetical protein